jgi:hypothetical protein
MAAHDGAVAEWLGRGLQSLAHQFDSGRRLFFSRRRQVDPVTAPTSPYDALAVPAFAGGSSHSDLRSAYSTSPSSSPST